MGSFVIPVGDLIDKLAEERLRETTAIKRIIDELEKIINGESVSSYSIQYESSTNMIMETFGDAEDYRIVQREEQNAATTKLFNDNDDIKKPLLLDQQAFINSGREDDEEEEKKNSDLLQMLASPRVNVRKLSTIGGKDKKGAAANPHKNVAGKIDKFGSGLKNELLEQ